MVKLTIGSSTTMSDVSTGLEVQRQMILFIHVRRGGIDANTVPKLSSKFSYFMRCLTSLLYIHTNRLKFNSFYWIRKSKNPLCDAYYEIIWMITISSYLFIFLRFAFFQIKKKLKNKRKKSLGIFIGLFLVHIVLKWDIHKRHHCYMSNDELTLSMNVKNSIRLWLCTCLVNIWLTNWF